MAKENANEERHHSVRNKINAEPVLTHHDIGQNRENRDQHIEEGQCANILCVLWLKREEI